MYRASRRIINQYNDKQYTLITIRVTTRGEVDMLLLDINGKYERQVVNYNTFKFMVKNGINNYKIVSKRLAFEIARDDLFGTVGYEILNDKGIIEKCIAYQDTINKATQYLGTDAWYEEQIRNL